LEALLAYGKNFCALGFYESLLLMSHSFAVNRGEYDQARALEELIFDWLQFERENKLVARAWLQKTERLLA